MIVDTSILTRSGIYFDYVKPTAHMIKIEDIAKALSNTCRFGGHSRFYSVAEHSVHCAQLAVDMELNNESVLYALMHDAQEAYIGDMPKPLKMIMPEFQALEERIERVVYAALGVVTTDSRTIKRIDMMMLKAEKLYLFSDDKQVWPCIASIPEVMIDIKCWTPERAETEFMGVWNELR